MAIQKNKKKLNKIDIYIILLSLFAVVFIVWCCVEFHKFRDEPTALIAMVGAYIVSELVSLAKIKCAKENGPEAPCG